jgi:hypothetical protein
VWRALREDAPVSLTHEQATALAGEFYRGWADAASYKPMVAIEHDPEFLLDNHIERIRADGTKEVTAWRRSESSSFGPPEWEAVLRRWSRMETIGTHELDKPPHKRRPFDLDNHKPSEPGEPDPRDLEKHLGPIVDRVLLARGIKHATWC